MDFSDLRSDAILRAQFRDKEFEEFFKRLLRAERELRHRQDAGIGGPVATYGGDGQRDLTFVVRSPPRCLRSDFGYPLTWDDIGETWYSCKGGSHWRESFLNELGQQAYHKFEKDQKTPGPRIKKRPSEPLLDYLGQGGRYVFVVAEPGNGDRGLLDAACQTLAFWLTQTNRQVPAELRQQLEFIDGNHLLEFMVANRPTTLTEAQRTALGLREIDGLKTWQQWHDELSEGRELPAFEVDAQRKVVQAAVADRSQSIIRVFGPPGTGKTRLIYEAIKRCGEDARNRTRYSQDIDLNLRAVEDLRRGGSFWLVLDELRSVDVDQVTGKFTANTKNNKDARLFLLGTSDDQSHAGRGGIFEINALGREQIERVVRSEARAVAGEQIAAICDLSEGYPWYAVLLARAVAEDEGVLESGDDEATRWNYGTRRVLAGNPQEYGDQNSWDREAELRAKALLVAMLTRDLELEWGTLWDRHGEALRLAIDEPQQWDEVKRREKVCRDRQILRQSGLIATRRYVSPNNLARLILHHFLTDPDLGPKIRRYTPELRGALLDIARAVRVKPALIEGLARGEWQELERRAREEGSESVEAYLRRPPQAHPSYQAAVELPEVAAETLARIVLPWDETTSRSAGNTRAVATSIFSHVIRRKISKTAFLRVEEALLQLARSDDAYFANGPRGIWRSLFLSAAHQTHQTWETRLARLDERLAATNTFERHLAVDALVKCADPREMGLGYVDDDRRDGDWPQVTVAEVRQQKSQLWDRLLAACTDDDLADAARKGVADCVRVAIGRGLYLEQLARLAAQVPSWTPAQRQSLLDTLADVRRYDMSELSKYPELLVGVGELERAAAPNNLAERVRAQFGSWHPGPWAIDDPQRGEHESAGDLAIAQDLLRDADTLAWALDWSRSDEAHRAPSLWLALGHADAGATLPDRLAEMVADGYPPGMLALYLIGWAEVRGSEAAEAWVRGLQSSDAGAFGAAILYFLVYQTPSIARAEWILSLVEEGAIALEAMVRLTHRNWASALEPDVLISLVQGLANHEAYDEATLRLSTKLLDGELSLRQRDAIFDILVPVLHRAFTQRVPISTQPAVNRIGAALARAGRLEFVAELVLAALDTNGDGSNIHLGHELLSTLLRANLGEQLWPYFAAALDGRPHPEVLTWQLAKQRLLSAVDPSTVLSWVGNDPRRGRLAAALSNPHGASLSPVVRELLRRFGPDSEVAWTLHRRALSTPDAMVGVMSFERRQLEHAQAWQQDPEPQVRQWAQTIEGILAQRIDEHEARQEFRRKYG